MIINLGRGQGGGPMLTRRFRRRVRTMVAVRSVLLIVAVAAPSMAFAAQASASAYSADWGCYSSVGAWCIDTYQHHSMGTETWYGDKTAALPLEAGSACADAGCNYSGWIYHAQTGQNGQGYADVLACWANCGANSPYLGNAEAESMHTSWHNIDAHDFWD